MAYSWSELGDDTKRFLLAPSFEDDDSEWEGIVVGILAFIVMFAIVLDIAQLALPFSSWVNWILALSFVIVAGIMGLVRTVASWALGAGAIIVGGAGFIAIVMSAVILLAVVIFLFFGGEWLQKKLQKIRGNRDILNAKRKGDKKAAEIVEGFEVGRQVGRGTD